MKNKYYEYNDIGMFNTYEECVAELRKNTTLEQLTEFGFDDFIAILKHGLKGDTTYFMEEYEKAFQNLCKTAINEWEYEDDE